MSDERKPWMRSSHRSQPKAAIAKPADIFISYSRSDLKFAHELAAALERSGFSVWYDHYLMGGELWRAAIDRRLADAKAVLVIWTDNSVELKWVQFEAIQAKNQAKERLLNIVDKKLDTTRLPIWVADTQLLDVADHEQLLQALAKRGVKSELGMATPEFSKEPKVRYHVDRVSPASIFSGNYVATIEGKEGEKFSGRGRTSEEALERALSKQMSDTPLDVESMNDWQYDDRLAAVRLNAIQTGEGRGTISCELNCQMSDLANMRVYIRRGKVSFNLGGALLEGLGSAEPPAGGWWDIRSKQVDITRGGSDRRPSWTVEALEGVIGEIDVPAPVMHIAHLLPGKPLTAVFSTYLKDVTPAAKSQWDGIVQEGGKPIGRAKQAVLELLGARRLLAGDGGHIELANASICFKKRSQ